MTNILSTHAKSSKTETAVMMLGYDEAALFVPVTGDGLGRCLKVVKCHFFQQGSPVVSKGRFTAMGSQAGLPGCS